MPELFINHFHICIHTHSFPCPTIAYGARIRKLGKTSSKTTHRIFHSIPLHSIPFLRKCSCGYIKLISTLKFENHYPKRTQASFPISWLSFAPFSPSKDMGIWMWMCVCVCVIKFQMKNTVKHFGRG